ncbi:hypothetical protein [Rhodopirellula bahusiensis]|uniref:Uncharacterized protein n=1 Tax=Rhodopirellula bahusiensis TaxID=2014065 RepID=A0A2G1VXM0_9BACT|nr:hypothetical protein [Rhodopirellula bahusiensis]PHQ31495.1 hypothetical protein CEE69_30815 [Rhodopirellula bahusiensis]
MNSNRLDDIRSQLETELECSAAEVGRLKAELAAAQKDHKAITDAVNALGRKPSSAPKKPSVKKVDMKKAIREQLRDQPSPCPVDELDAALRDHFTRKGCSLTGFALRLKEVLADDEIEQTEAGIALAAMPVGNG